MWRLFWFAHDCFYGAGIAASWHLGGYLNASLLLVVALCWINELERD